MISYGWPWTVSHGMLSSSVASYGGGIGRFYGVRPVYPPVVLKTFQLLECGHCGNKWPEEIRLKYHNCPTCAGSYK